MLFLLSKRHIYSGISYILELNRNLWRYLIYFVSLLFNTFFFLEKKIKTSLTCGPRRCYSKYFDFHNTLMKGTGYKSYV